MMIMLGGWWITVGLAALVNDDLYVASREYIFRFDATAWGWTHLGTGILLLLAGLGLFRGAVWARTVGVIMALVATLVGLAWLPWYPVWAILSSCRHSIMGTLTAHGRDVIEV